MLIQKINKIYIYIFNVNNLNFIKDKLRILFGNYIYLKDVLFFKINLNISNSKILYFETAVYFLMGQV
jgi:hypothetical protein